MTSPKNVILMANTWTGLEVCRYLRRAGDHLVRLYVTDADDEWARRITEASQLPPERVFLASAVRDAHHVAELARMEVDFLVTVYWPYLLEREVFSLAREGTANLHPALLPINRGWYPHVHSMLDGTPLGVTLHTIDEGADTGPIWAQRQVLLGPHDTAKTIYDRLQKEIVQLFKDTWPRIRTGQITPQPQDHSRAIYHKKSEVDALDYIDPNRTCSARELINLLRARSFGDKGFAYYEEDGQRVYMNLRLSKEMNF